MPLRDRAGRRPRVRPARTTPSSSARSSTARPTSSTDHGSSVARPHRVLYFWHYVGNKVLTTASNMVTNLNLTDMETCFKAFRLDALRRFTIEENRFGVEPEITAKVARLGLTRLRGRHQLRRPDLCRGKEDRMARRRQSDVLHRGLFAAPENASASSDCHRSWAASPVDGPDQFASSRMTPSLATIVLAIASGGNSASTRSRSAGW